MKVALFITCLTDNFYPRAGIATVRLLEHFGCRVEFPYEQTCCGQPMFNNGMLTEARRLARDLIRVFEPYEAIVTPSGSCAAMVREHFAEMFDDDPAQRRAAENVAGRTYELVEFLVRVLKIDLREDAPRWEGRVTYHYSCHLRGLGITDEAVQLLGQVDGVQFAPLEKVEQCCGFGGTFAVNYPAISGAMVRDKVECIRATGAEALISNDAGCTMNIAGACRRHGVDVRILTLAELLAEAIGLLPRSDRLARSAVIAGGTSEPLTRVRGL